MDEREHFYSDDPTRGPADGRTTLPGVDYFFLGNGHIQAAVQICPAGQATPLGLLIMDPHKLGPKRDALTFDAGAGLHATMVRIRSQAAAHEPRGAAIDARWTEVDGVPAVTVSWSLAVSQSGQ